MHSTGNYHACVKAHMMTYDLYLLVQEKQRENLSRTIWGGQARGKTKRGEQTHPKCKSMIIVCNPDDIDPDLRGHWARELPGQ